MTHFKLLKKEQGLSLAELLVASILIGIVLIGVVSFSFAIKQFQKTTDKTTILAMRAETAMSYLRRDIEKAIGDGSYFGSANFATENLNIDSGSGIRKLKSGQDTSLCLRHDDAQTPTDYSDDTWICYCTNKLMPQMLKRCIGVVHNSVPIRINGDNCACVDPGQCVSHQDIMTFTKGKTNFFEITTVDPNDPASSILYITITLDTSWDGNAENDPLTNPNFILKSTIYPISHSQ